jgi:cell division protein ZapA
LADSKPIDAGSTPVTIFGRTYHLRGHGDPEYLSLLATRVDEKMREVARTTGTADTLKVAILAALNLADDGIQGREVQVGRISSEELARIGEMTARLDEILATDATG